MIFPKISKQAADFAAELGEPRFGRRLSDKILAAYTHAYSLGRLDLAERLMDALQLCGEADGLDRSGEALERAKSWVRFVQARNLYNEVAQNKGDDAPETVEALAAMKAAHGDWDPQ